MSNDASTGMICHHCHRPILSGGVFAGVLVYHAECARSPYALPPEQLVLLERAVIALEKMTPSMAERLKQ